MGNGSGDKFFAVIDANLYAQLTGDMKFTVILNEIAYERGSETKIYDSGDKYDKPDPVMLSMTVMNQYPLYMEHDEKLYRFEGYAALFGYDVVGD